MLFGKIGDEDSLAPWERFLRKVANVVSVTFHPMMMPIYAMLYVLYCNQLWAMLPSVYKTVAMLYISAGTCVLPLMALSLMIVFGLVGDPEMPNKSERVLPLAVSALMLLVTCFFLHNQSRVVFPPVIIRLADGMFLMLVLALIITPVWKISLHSMGVGALLAYVCIVGIGSKVDFSLSVSFAFAIAGLVTWARLYLGSHTPLQLLWGLVVGVNAMGLAILYK